MDWQKLSDNGIPLPFIRSPRLHRGDALLTILILSAVIGLGGFVIATLTKVAPDEGATVLWGIVFGGSLVTYSAKKLTLKAGPVEIRSSGPSDTLPVDKGGRLDGEA